MCYASLVTCPFAGCERIAVVKVTYCQGSRQHQESQIYAKGAYIRMERTFCYSEPPGCSGLRIRDTLFVGHTLCRMHNNPNAGDFTTETSVGPRRGDGYLIQSSEEVNGSLARGVAAINLNGPRRYDDEPDEAYEVAINHRQGVLGTHRNNENGNGAGNLDNANWIQVGNAAMRRVNDQADA